MAAGDEHSVETSSPVVERNASATDGAPATGTGAESGEGTTDQKSVDNHDGRRRGEKGRAERSRQLKNDKKRKKQDDWREFKRRKLSDKKGEPGAPEKKNPFSKEEIASEERRPKRKVAVMIGYSGTGYKGMQVNGDEATIERDLFRAFIDAKAISKANADDPRKSSLARCARTDKGVHAAGNVISLKLIIEDEDIVEKINAHLPEQIRIWGIQRTNNSFNCYQYCDSRFYEYLMPSYCLLPPHPQTYLAKKCEELNKEYGAEEEVAAVMADVKDFWADVEEKEIKPILAGLDHELRAVVMERVHAQEAEEYEKKKNGESEQKEAPASEAEKSDEANGVTEKSGEANGTAAEPEPKKVSLESHKPKHRDLAPIDFALRDIKATYIAAKRRYRVSPERLQRLQQVLDKYTGTNNFHNFTIQKAYSDPSARRHIKSFAVNPKPIIIGDTEWLSLKVHGQSFMMHQIRKMVGLASLMVRCGTTLDRVGDSYQEQKMAIPKAPGLGLLLERPVFENYNRRAKDTLGKETIDFGKYEQRLEAFKQQHIYSRIFEVEERENTYVLQLKNARHTPETGGLLTRRRFHGFYNQIDQFKANHFLWLSAGGTKVAELNKESDKTEVDKALGDEDENPEGGEG
ncbi:tRNA pseudouridine synthase [Metarhizium album ARSEF 1941]|uniref:tRNA pseudouridine synthase 1 n=1 Tax=Metarhizium album (strain ARSEF 1941) TaxID=1081103 RepID=A0A0B2WUL2_METAS|nr:tRNA pseudouridine synthase [Metarhizium album ARSEF 1941]KHN99736.1 tRNA pseudouridine synthase [Metarhizium album ARSEF 1941]